MSNRNFDSRVIIQRLQDQNRARNIYLYNTSGKAIINNPQTSDGSASLINTFNTGSQTTYYRGLIGAGLFSSIGGTIITPTTPIIPPSPPVIYSWAATVSGPLIDACRGVCVDTNNNIYGTGFYNINTTLTNVSVNSYSTISSGFVQQTLFGNFQETGSIANRHPYIVKYNNIGTVQWALSMLGSVNDEGWDVITDSSNDLYNTGSFNNSTIINNFSTVSSGIILQSTVGTLLSQGFQDGYLIKYNTNGQYLWGVNIGSGSGGAEQTSAVTVDIFNNVYTTTTYNSTLFINQPSTISSNIIQVSSIARLSSIGSPDIAILKYNSSGQFLWATNLGTTTNTDFERDIKSDSFGNVYVTGTANIGSGNFLVNNFEAISSGTISTSLFGIIPQITTISGESFITKYNSAGKAQWALTIGNLAGSTEQGWSLAIDNNQNIYNTGFFQASTQFNNFSTVSSNIILQSTIGILYTQSNNNDIYVTKYNPNGQFLWATSITGDSSDQSRALTTDSNGNVYVGGWFNSLAGGLSTIVNEFSSINGTNIVVTPAGRFINNPGNNEACIIKYSPTGKLIWGTTIAGVNSDQTWGLATDSNNNIYASGNFVNQLSQTGITINSFSTISSGIILLQEVAKISSLNNNQDSFVIKFNENGQFVV